PVIHPEATFNRCSSFIQTSEDHREQPGLDGSVSDRQFFERVNGNKAFTSYCLVLSLTAYNQLCRDLFRSIPVSRRGTTQTAQRRRLQEAMNVRNPVAVLPSPSLPENVRLTRPSAM